MHAGIDEGCQNINDFATPVPTTTGLVLLTAGALGLTTIVVDVLAVSLRRPAVSGLALLALYAVPVAVVLGGVPWVLFAIAAWATSCCCWSRAGTGWRTGAVRGGAPRSPVPPPGRSRPRRTTCRRR